MGDIYYCDECGKYVDYSEYVQIQEGEDIVGRDLCEDCLDSAIIAAVPPRSAALRGK